MIEINQTFTEKNATKLLEELMMLLVERMGNFPEETKKINIKAWEQLLAYLPSEVSLSRLLYGKAEVYNEFATRETQQAPGPHRPNGKTLGYICEDIIGKGEIEEIVINGQTGMLYITTNDGKKSETQKFDMAGISDAL